MITKKTRIALIRVRIRVLPKLDRIRAICTEQFGMRATFGNAAFVKDDNEVCHARRGDAMCDENRDSSAAGDPLRGLKIAREHGIFDDRIESGCRLVEEEKQRLVAHHGAGNSHPC